MTLFDWLSTPPGLGIVNAFTLLIVAIAAYISYLARSQSAKNEKLIDGHIQQHVDDALSQIEGENKISS